MDFDTISTFDAELAEEGAWLDAKRGDKVYISARCRYVDGITQSGELEFKRARGRVAKTNKGGKPLDEFDYAIVGLAYVHMRDWKGVTLKGEPVPFSPEAARAFFAVDANRWMALSLLTQVADVTNFRGDMNDEFDVEEVTGN
jgi:hypothetical protein